jgi:hypothetical protein
VLERYDNAFGELIPPLMKNALVDAISARLQYDSARQTSKAKT